MRLAELWRELLVGRSYTLAYTETKTVLPGKVVRLSNGARLLKGPRKKKLLKEK